MQSITYKKKQALNLFFDNPYSEGSLYSFVNARAFQIFLYSHQFDQFYSYDFRCLQWFNIMSSLYEGLFSSINIEVPVEGTEDRFFLPKSFSLKKKGSCNSGSQIGLSLFLKGSGTRNSHLSRVAYIQKRHLLWIYQVKKSLFLLRKWFFEWL